MVHLIVTRGVGSLNTYSQKLSEHIQADLVQSDLLCPPSGLFKAVPWLQAFLQNYRFLRMLWRLSGVVHLPNQYLGKYGCYLKKPFIITVHDLIGFFDLWGHGIFKGRPKLRGNFYLNLDLRGIRKAARIIAVSQNTKRDLRKYLGIPNEKIKVIYEGIDHSIFRPRNTSPLICNPYVLYVGAEHPRKNLTLLFTAFKKLKQEKRFKNYKLVKVGEPGGDFRGPTLGIIRDLGLQGDIVFTGHVTEDLVAQYYSGAECLVSPSFYEGFGLTLLEAMACGCPVITTNVTSIPEVVGDAAITIDPKNIDMLTEKLRRVLTSEELKQKLCEEGIKRASIFSWEKTGRETMELYLEEERK